MGLSLGFCLALACLTEAEWRPVRHELGLARLPPAATLSKYRCQAEAYQRELEEHLADRPGYRAAHLDTQDRLVAIRYAEAALAEKDPWQRLRLCHDVREMVGDGPYYHGPFPGPVNVNFLPWYDAPRGQLLGVPDPAPDAEEP